MKNFVKWFRRSFNDYSHVFDMESLIGKLRTDFDPRGPIPTHEVNGRVDTSGGLYNDGMIHHMRKADSEFSVNFTATAWNSSVIMRRNGYQSRRLQYQEKIRLFLWLMDGHYDEVG